MINQYTQKLVKHVSKDSWVARLSVAKQRISYVNKINENEQKLSQVLAIMEGVLILSSFAQALCEVLDKKKVPYSALHRVLAKYSKDVEALKNIRVSRICVNVFELRNRYAHSDYLKSQDLALDVLANKDNIINLYRILILLYRKYECKFNEFENFKKQHKSDSISEIISLNSELIQFIFSIMDYRGVILRDSEKEQIVKEFVRGSKVANLKVTPKTSREEQDALLDFVESRMSVSMKDWNNNVEREIAITKFVNQLKEEG